MARAGDHARRHIGTFATRAEAEDALIEAYEFWTHQNPQSGSARTLITYGRQWLIDERARGRRRGLDRETARFDRHVARAPFATWPLTAITQRDVQRWINEVADGRAEGPRAKGQRRSRRTVSNVLNLLRAILRSALEAELIDVSPAAGVRIPRTPSKKEEFTYLEADELERLRTTTSVPIARHSAFLVAAYAGLRPGELWGLLWGDVILNGRPELIVRHSRRNATKGGRVRRVPLLEPARDALARWRAEQRDVVDELSRSVVRDAALVWPSPSGGTYADGHDAGWVHRTQTPRSGAKYTQLGWSWHGGIYRHVPLKSLRHTCACHLLRGTHVPRGWIARALRLEEVQAWLGHKSFATTEKYYARLAPGGLLDVVPGANP